MTLQEIIRRVQRLYGDSAEAQIYVTDIIDWVNDAQFVLSRALELLTANTTYDVTSTTATTGWLLADDYIKSSSVYFLNSPLTYVDYNDIKDYLMNQPADPGFYYIRGKYIKCYPKPVTLGTAIVSHDYVRMPLQVRANLDVSEVPSANHLDIVRYCLMRAKELNEDEQAVNRINQEFVNMVAESKFQMNPALESYPVVRDYDGDFWGMTTAIDY